MTNPKAKAPTSRVEAFFENLLRRPSLLEDRREYNRDMLQKMYDIDIGETNWLFDAIQLQFRTSDCNASPESLAADDQFLAEWALFTIELVTKYRKEALEQEDRATLSNHDPIARMDDFIHYLKNVTINQ